MNEHPTTPVIGLSFLVPTQADSPYQWRDARVAAAFLLSLFEQADYAMELQADTLHCVTLVTRRPLSPTMGHLALYVRPHDEPDEALREWVIEFDVTASETMTPGDVYFLYLTRILLGRLLARLSGVEAVFDLDGVEDLHAGE